MSSRCSQPPAAAPTANPHCLQRYQGGEFSLYFANCEPDSAIDFDVEVALYNVRGALAFASVRRERRVAAEWRH